MDRNYLSDVVRRMGEYRPGSLLAVGEVAAGLAGELRDARAGLAIDCVTAPDPLAELRARGRYDLALVAGALLARVRDIHAPRLLALVPVGERWPGYASRWVRGDLIAFGMTLAAEYEGEGRALELDAFDIASYKHTPDWLNGRYWAHPELFDKFRW